MSLFAFGVAVTLRVTCLLTMVAGIAALLRKRSAALQHALWSSAIIASLSVPIVSIAVAKSGTPTIALEDVSAAWTWIGRSVREHQTPVSEANGVRTPRSLDPSTSIAIAELFNGTSAIQGPLSTLATAATVIWLLGALVFLGRLSASLLALARLKHRARPLDDPRAMAVFREISKGRQSRAALLESDQITAPATGGVVSPTIFLPPDAREWPVTRLRATIAHEYAHVDRRDCLTQLFADLARAIYWLNPLIWYARRRSIIERERACDDLVVAHGIPPDKYATVLVDTVRGSFAQPGTIALGALSMARPSELETRLVSILDPARSRTRLSRTTTAAVAGSLALATILFAGTRVEAAPAIQFLEPDLRGDSIADPLSEKLQLGPEVWVAARNSAALYGPDSTLARTLSSHLDRVPSWEGDLVRDRSAWALSISRNRELIGPLLEALTDRDWRVRAYAAWTLAEARESRALPRLVPLLDSPIWRMRAMAAFAITAIASPTSASRMNVALHDEAWQVRLAAVKYFAALSDARYEPALEAATKDRHVAVRTAAGEGLRTLTRNH